MELFLVTMCALLFVLSVALLIKYKRLLAKHNIVVNELCDYLDADKQEESEWGNVR